jgi:hypothetical protein
MKEELEFLLSTGTVGRPLFASDLWSVAHGIPILSSLKEKVDLEVIA